MKCPENVVDRYVIIAASRHQWSLVFAEKLEARVLILGARSFAPELANSFLAICMLSEIRQLSIIWRFTLVIIKWSAYTAGYFVRLRVVDLSHDSVA